MRIVRTIWFQLMAIILICCLVPTLVFGVYIYKALIPDIRAKNESSILMETENTLGLGIKKLERLYTLARDATYDGELNSAWAAYCANTVKRAELIRLSRNYIERKYSREDLLTCAVFFTLDDPDLLMYDRSGYEQAERFRTQAMSTVLEAEKTLDTECRLIMAGGDLYLIRNLTDSRLVPYGMLVLGIDTEKFAMEAAALAAKWSGECAIRVSGAETLDSTVWSVTLSGVVSDSLPDTAGLSETENDSVICFLQQENRDTTVEYVLTVPETAVYGESRSFQKLSVLLLIMMIPILLIVSLYVWKRIVRPITILSTVSHKIENGEFGVTVPMHGKDELGRLGAAFSHMSLRLKDLIDRTYKEEIALRDAQIQAMQSRINPHFINNALESVNWQARLEGAESVSASIDSLSVLLNASMSRKGRSLVLFSEELEVARAYFHFVSQRFGDALEITQDIAADTQDAILPLLTLQPVLENAVEHGISPAGGGKIALRASLAGNMLKVEIENTGRMPSEEDRERILSAISGGEMESGHLGLSNISSRLRLIYRGKAVVEPDIGNGHTLIRLMIPQDAALAEADRTGRSYETEDWQ